MNPHRQGEHCQAPGYRERGGERLPGAGMGRMPSAAYRTSPNDGITATANAGTAHADILRQSNQVARATGSDPSQSVSAGRTP